MNWNRLQAFTGLGGPILSPEPAFRNLYSPVKGKVDPKTVRAILRHSRIQTTLDLYTQGDGDETRAAQGAFLKELGLASELIQ